MFWILIPYFSKISLSLHCFSFFALLCVVLFSLHHRYIIRTKKQRRKNKIEMFQIQHVVFKIISKGNLFRPQQRLLFLPMLPVQQIGWDSVQCSWTLAFNPIECFTGETTDSIFKKTSILEIQRLLFLLRVWTKPFHVLNQMISLYFSIVC